MIQEIRTKLEPHFSNFEKFFSDLIAENASIVQPLQATLWSHGGKQIRPMLVMMSAQLNGAISTRSYRSASLIEMLHTATLVHDDVVDNSSTRRGKPSVNAQFGNATAVLLGDYLYARALRIAIEHKDYDILKVVAGAIEEMSEGELIQSKYIANREMTEEIYFDIISKKTAMLLAACCASGAYSANASQENIDLMHQVGMNIGLVFQIKDDLLDLDLKNKALGKPTGNDIREQKLTLPLIHYLNSQPKEKADEMFDLFLKSDVDNVLLHLQKSDCLRYAELKMQECVKNVKQLLSHYQNKECIQMFDDLLEFIMNRNH